MRTTNMPTSKDVGQAVALSWRLYLLITLLITTVISGTVNALLALAMYSERKATATRVWSFPNTLGGDLIITAIVTCIVTWVISPSLAMRDLVIGSPIRIKPSSFPKFPMSMPRWFTHRPLFVSDPHDRVSRGVALLHQLRAGFVVGLAFAVFLAVPISIVLGVAEARAGGGAVWHRKTLVWVKALFGGLGAALCAHLSLWILINQHAFRVSSKTAESGFVSEGSEDLAEGVPLLKDESNAAVDDTTFGDEKVSEGSRAGSSERLPPAAVALDV
ncbi:hypothetical protein FOZ63_000194 [Perkinsus olseni]|uniref:Uncharacterized protein n=1 Tax=Perkinsus olseni TaxID=32597 RepID=A0A7J6RYU3_PEROL|nr:hypothetical protein FOZ63_000194 [Perkinsus olseni]KAF4725867.1 hypothetical protein FOZ62_006222 [Perkinsus olseni]